ncbi:LuxR C-terminal-related transcriptional regulator [Streptomyces sp. NPDC058686]|uniref:LuxR C-terminal-related transcriptional regulator n=1 Tax=Streptomyces sp. NPDC058686 TaxID=3346599 RepID=UPI003651C2ED
MTAPASKTPLTPSEQSTAQAFVNGKTVPEIAAAAAISPHTVRGRLYSMRRKLHCPDRCAPHVVIHRTLSAAVATAPRPSSPAPKLGEQHLSLLKAITENSTPFQIARGAGIPSGDVQAAIDELLYLTGATDTADLVRRAYGWGLLTSEQTHAAMNGGVR